MDYLWTPWRYRFVAQAGEPVECIFCAAANPQADDHELLVVHRARHNFIILNRFPYTTGHVMVVPIRHVATLEDLDNEALAELIFLAKAAEKCLRHVYHPDGINLGMNIGKSAGAGIAAHLHLHVLPRWYGDANFMTVIGETRVMPEDLETTWERLRSAFAAE
ncbi:MAG TPA: HIT domain-containing protein [Bryobacteraceae bacterium]|nr:HIT domain-containing protein [Bryobacteraceae bacterium]